MSNASWETLSNQAIAMAGLVYFIALIVHLAEWAALREPRSAAALVGAGGPDTDGDAVADGLGSLPGSGWSKRSASHTCSSSDFGTAGTRCSAGWRVT